MGVLSWIILGGLAGWVGSRITGRQKQMGLLANIIVGIIGAVVGGFIANLVGRAPVFGLNFQSFFVALLGTVVFLFVLSAIQRRG
jgi:uncharacterized membrane protein YeaQ/YmgE (transglycosylase-associated protein family)